MARPRRTLAERQAEDVKGAEAVWGTSNNASGTATPARTSTAWSDAHKKGMGWLPTDLVERMDSAVQRIQAERGDPAAQKARERWGRPRYSKSQLVREALGQFLDAMG